MIEKYVAQRTLKDGSILRLKVYENGDRYYQLNLVCGHVISQFPTVDRMPEKTVRENYESIQSREDFQRVLESYGRPTLHVLSDTPIRTKSRKS